MPNDLNTNLALVLNGLGAMPSGSVGVRLSTQASAAGVSNVSTTETDLLTYTLPANGLNSNGQMVRITVRGTLANNANVKTLRLYFGSTAIAVSSGAGTSVWAITGWVIRTSATAQLGFADQAMSGIANWAPGANTTPAETLSGAVVIKVTGQSNTASNDATALAMLVEWLP